MPKDKNVIQNAMNYVENVLIGVANAKGVSMPQGLKQVDSKTFESDWAKATPAERKAMIEAQGGAGELLKRHGK